MRFTGIVFGLWALIMLIVERPELGASVQSWLGLESLWKLAWHPGVWAMARAIGEIGQAIAVSIR
ncbi:MAG: hypothetical protein RMM10_12915 [Anaerolineae bacterium]|uniref:hypothetical protein n=1 Tax=Thermoflexus sp. TaxID=1969742 RepID=UPI002600C2FF|nr:hypothetical protein [Thermoflexus sp.]MCS7352384.1 hypothetical protein [Thermoflexus sp.]MDW8181850.1 hypothetical protein [Anaerolineae bacterium]